MVVDGSGVVATSVVVIYLGVVVVGFDVAFAGSYVVVGSGAIVVGCSVFDGSGVVVIGFGVFVDSVVVVVDCVVVGGVCFYFRRSA